MEIFTSWMEREIEQGEQKLIKRQLKRLFNISEDVENRINNSSIFQIENLADIIFDLKSLDDLILWLNSQTEGSI